jgi:ribosomal protein L10
MSKAIKQLQMNALRDTFRDVRDLVVLSVKGLNCHDDHALRASLRKKQVRLQVVKTSLTRRVFGELGIQIGDDSPYWQEPVMLAWGASSAGELSRAVQGELKDPKRGPLYKDKVKVKGGVAEGQPCSFEAMIGMPTRQEALAAVLALILGPGSAVAGCLTGPGGQVASQIESKTKADETQEAGAEAPAAAG